MSSFRNDYIVSRGMRGHLVDSLRLRLVYDLVRKFLAGHVFDCVGSISDTVSQSLPDDDPLLFLGLFFGCKLALIVSFHEFVIPASDVHSRQQFLVKIGQSARLIPVAFEHLTDLC